MWKKIEHRKQFLIFFLMLLIISGLAYLPLLLQFGYFNDDWYLMYDAYTQGANFFHEIYKIDRPARAFVLESLFSFFGVSPLPYNLSAYLFRFLGGICFYWVLRLLWPKQQTVTLLSAILFTIYPGFLSQHNAIDYQSQILGLWIAILSLVFTLKAVPAKRGWVKGILIILAVISAWFYLGLVVYFVVFEIIRLALVVVLIWREQGRNFWQKTKSSALTWLPFAAAPAGFLLWRIFFFETERRATDIGAQVGQLFTSPLTGLWWLVYLLRDALNVTLVAWGWPLYTLAFQLRLRDTLIGLGLAMIALIVTLAGLHWGVETDDETEAASNSLVTREIVFVGLVSIFGGLLPVVIANRHILYPDFSRYSLVASMGVAILIASLISQISSRATQMALAGFFIVVSVMTHHANSVNAVQTTERIRNFWWQVSWRVPDLEPGVNLIASYPDVAAQEDYFVWSPANFIYAPEIEKQTPIEIEIGATVLNEETMLNVLTGKGDTSPDRRGNIVSHDFKQVLVLAQATPDGCLRVLDGRQPELSVTDDVRIRVIAPYSDLANVIVDGSHATPLTEVFGTEPPRGWCFYYQKADLARQRGDWNEVVSLGNRALAEGYYPADRVEWMPFLQAYAVTGERDGIHNLVPILSANHALRLQACEAVTFVAEQRLLEPEMITYTQESFCE